MHVEGYEATGLVDVAVVEHVGGAANELPPPAGCSFEVTTGVVP